MNTEVKDVPTSRGPQAAARLPEQTHVGAVHLQVADLQRSLDYYRGVLGLDLLERDAGRASLGMKGAVRPLAHLVERQGATPVWRRRRFGLSHFAILLPDRAALGRFAAHVLGLRLRPGMADRSVSEAPGLAVDGAGNLYVADTGNDAIRRIPAPGRFVPTFAVLFLAPDVSFAGYLAGPRIGAALYNLAHSCVGPLILAATLLSAGVWPPFTLVWVAHIGFDVPWATVSSIPLRSEIPTWAESDRGRRLRTSSIVRSNVCLVILPDVSAASSEEC